VNNLKWDKRFLDMAMLVASWSKDPSTGVGAVIVDEHKRIVSVGFNGFAKGVHDLPEHLEHRPTKYEKIIHAEMNAILFAQRPLDTCTLYIYPLPPCARCAACIIQSGIRNVVVGQSNVERDAESQYGVLDDITRQMFLDAGVRIIVLNREIP